MLTIEIEKSFEKDYKRLNKKHYDFCEFRKVLFLLKNEKNIPHKYKDHHLKGDKQGYKECHIENDIILIYQIVNNKLILYRIGSHKDLLNK